MPFPRTATRHWSIWDAPFGPVRKQSSALLCSLELATASPAVARLAANCFLTGCTLRYIIEGVLVYPEVVFGLLRRYSDRLELHLLAVVIRLVLGVCLIYQASVSKYPLAIEIIGWLSILAAVFFAVIGRNKFIQLMAWALSMVNINGRVAGLFASIFGAFIIDAFI